MVTARTTPSSRPPLRPVTVVAIGMVAIGLGAAMGFIWGFIATSLRLDLGITRAQVGVLIGLFFGSAGIGSVGGGILTDQLGARLAVAIDLVLVAVSCAAVVFAPSYPVLMVASVVCGAAYSLSNAGTNVAIAATVPLLQRAIALTAKTAGVPIMAAVAALIGPWASVRFGWTSVFACVALLAAVAAVGAMVALPPDRPDAAARARDRRALPAGFLWMPVASFLLITGSQPLFAWVVPYLEEAVGVATAWAGGVSSLATAIGVVGMLLIARRSDRLGPRARLATVATGCIVTAGGVALTALGASLGAWIVVVGAGLGLASQLGAIGVMHAAVVDLVPEAVGRASGVTMTGYYLGALGAPAGFGAVVDRTGTYTVAWGLSALSLVAAGLAFRRARQRLVPEPVDERGR